MPRTKVIAYVVVGIVVAVLIAAAILIATSLKTLQSYEVALKYNTIQMQLDPIPLYEGLHTGPPGFALLKFSNVFKTLTFESLMCLNRDGVHIYLDISFQYRVRAKDLEYIIKQFRDNDGYIKVLNSIGKSAIHDSCSVFNTSQFQSQRGLYQEDVLQRIVDKFDDVSCDVTDLQVNNIRRPSRYEEAIRTKESAREDIRVAMNERPRQLTEAETQKREAETQYIISINRAETDARIILNQAQTRASAILNDFQKEAEVYRSLTRSLSLDTAGFLSYLSVRTIENAHNDVYIGMDAPARSTWLT